MAITETFAETGEQFMLETYNRYPRKIMESHIMNNYIFLTRSLILLWVMASKMSEIFFTHSGVFGWSIYIQWVLQYTRAPTPCSLSLFLHFWYASQCIQHYQLQNLDIETNFISIYFCSNLVGYALNALESACWYPRTPVRRSEWRKKFFDCVS